MSAEVAPGVGDQSVIVSIGSPVRDQFQLPNIPPDNTNPRFLNIDTFHALDGVTQEAALIQLLKIGDFSAVGRFRPDFEMDKKLTGVETTVYDAIDKITRRSKPIKGPNKMFGDLHDDWEYTKLAAMIYDYDLPRKLEAERIRRAETPGLFFSHEVMGGFLPARRYRRLLEMEAERQRLEEIAAAQEPSEGETQNSVTVLQGDRAA